MVLFRPLMMMTSTEPPLVGRRSTSTAFKSSKLMRVEVKSVEKVIATLETRIFLLIETATMSAFAPPTRIKMATEPAESLRGWVTAK